MTEAELGLGWKSLLFRWGGGRSIITQWAHATMPALIFASLKSPKCAQMYRFSSFCLAGMPHYPSSRPLMPAIFHFRKYFGSVPFFQFLSAGSLFTLLLSCLSLPFFRPLPAIYHFRKTLLPGFGHHKIFRLKCTDFQFLSCWYASFSHASHYPYSDLCQQFIIFEKYFGSNVVEVFDFHCFLNSRKYFVPISHVLLVCLPFFSTSHALIALLQTSASNLSFSKIFRRT